MLAAFGAVKMLAEVERVNDELKRELEQSRTVEAGLRDRTTALEREVETSKSRTRYVILLFIHILELTLRL